MKRYNKLVILIGALMILAGLAWMVEPYYTWAQEQNSGHPCRVALDPDDTLFELENMNPGDSTTKTVTVTKTGSSAAQLYFAWEYMEGDPELGEEGSLFDQLNMVITSDGTELFSGKMSDWKYDRENPSINDTINLTEKLGMTAIRQGEEITLLFEVHLPGPETGNEFQGSTVTARLVFFTICNGTPPPPGERPRINIEKATNGVDADVPTGPFIPTGEPVTWTYVVTNTGDVSLRNVVVTDNIAGVNPVYVSGDDNGDGILQVRETWIFEAVGVAEAGQYANIGRVEGTSPRGIRVTDDDPSHYFGITADEPAINIEKATNGVDADLPTGPEIEVGETVTWTYVVTNPGNVPLSNIVVTDNIGGVNPVYVSGDTNEDGILQEDETWIFEAEGVAEAGQYANLGMVVGSPPTGANVSDIDPSHYFGVEEPTEETIDPEDPAVEPEDEDQTIIIVPETPLTDPPLPRTDGVSTGLLAAGLLFLLAGISLRKGSLSKA